MTRTVTIVRRPEERERGAVLVIFALTIVVLVGMLAIALDLGYGFVQNRQAQNASDFAAFAISQQLNNASTCNGVGTTPNMAQVVAVAQDVVKDNAPNVGTAWTGHFLDGKGNPLAGAGATFTSASSNASNFPPLGACGASLVAVPTWKPFFAGVFGVNQLSGNGNAKATNIGQGPPYGIISLNKVGPHAILGGGTGTFIVNGDVIVNSNVANQPWTESWNNWQFDDAIDAKSGSNLYVYGTINTPSGTYGGEPLWPLDWCFGAAGIVGESTSEPTDQSGDPTYSGSVTSPAPTYGPACSVGSVTVKYNHLYPFMTQLQDPLQQTGAPPNPFTAQPTCPGMSLQTFSGTTYASGTLEPGEYTHPVKITGPVTFGDCSAFGSGEPAYPGVYLFTQGLWIDPPAGDTVSGSNIVISTQAPYPLSGNVGSSGTGNGAPCLPNPTTSSAGDPGGSNEVNAPTAPCPGTSDYGVMAYQDAGPFSQDTSNYGTGNNFSLIVGGGSGSQVNLTGPTFGGYGGIGQPGLVFYQDPGTQANYGFDAEPGDAAAISLTGVVYNGSLGANPTWDFWDNGIPFYAGGTLQTGFGAGWTSSTGPTPSTGSVTITGTAIVDDFNTDGATTITILGQPYTLPGNAHLSLVG